MTRPTKQKQYRREALREQLKGLEYLRQINHLIKSEWGDEVAEKNAKLNHYFKLLNKVLPDAKDERVILKIDVSQSLSKQAEQVLSAVLTGDILPSQGNILMNQISRVSNIRLDDDLEKRIEELEKEFANDER